MSVQQRAQVVLDQCPIPDITAVPDFMLEICRIADSPGSFHQNTDRSALWLPARIWHRFGTAVMEQSDQLQIPNQRISSLISYCVSPFAAICMTTAISLDRTSVFASSSSMSRTRTRLPFPSHVLLRLIALFLLFAGSYGVLVALKSGLKSDHTATNPLIEWTLSSSYFDYDYDSFKDLTFLGIPYISKSFLDFDQAPLDPKHLLIGPPPSILKPFYLSLCLSGILEAFIAATNGEEPLIESGLTYFELSIAFQEVQSAALLSYELSVICFTVVLSQMANHLMGLFNLQKYRLIPSSAIGSFVLSFCFFSILQGKISYFPVIVILGYAPQIFTLCIIHLCMGIFVMAAVAKGSYKDLEFSKITNNFESINILMTDDFYTALTNLGTFMLNAAAKASYVKEVSEIRISDATWLESPAKVSRGSLISMITGYGNQVDVPPDLEELREKESKSTENSGSGIVVRRFVDLRRCAENFKQVAVSFLITHEKPQFLVDQEADARVAGTPVESTERSGQIEFSADDADDDEYVSDGEMGSDDAEESDPDWDYDADSDGADDDLPVLAELISSPQDLVALVVSEQASAGTTDAALSEGPSFKILKSHLLRGDQRIITRSSFNRSEPTASTLWDLILEKRSANDGHRHRHRHGGYEDDDDDDGHKQLPECVICQTNARGIILWPCKCLAICESCRVSLMVREFKECVCCRRKVEAYSKVFVP